MVPEGPERQAAGGALLLPGLHQAQEGPHLEGDGERAGREGGGEGAQVQEGQAPQREDLPVPRRHHQAGGGRHRQRRQQLPARRRRCGRLHPPGRRAAAHRRVPDPAELRDRPGQDHRRLPAARQVCHPHGGAHRLRGAQRQPGRRAPQLLPEQPRPAAGARAALGGVPLHLHRRVWLPQRGGGGGSAGCAAGVAGAAQGQGGPADHLCVPGEG